MLRWLTGGWNQQNDSQALITSSHQRRPAAAGRRRRPKGQGQGIRVTADYLNQCRVVSSVRAQADSASGQRPAASRLPKAAFLTCLS